MASATDVLTRVLFYDLYLLTAEGRLQELAWTIRNVDAHID